MMESLLPEWAVAGYQRERTGAMLPNVSPSNVYPTARRRPDPDRRQPGHRLRPAGRGDGRAGAGRRTRATRPTRPAARRWPSSTTCIAEWTATLGAEQLLETLHGGGVPGRADLPGPGHVRRPALRGPRGDRPGAAPGLRRAADAERRPRGCPPPREPSAPPGRRSASTTTRSTAGCSAWTARNRARLRANGDHLRREARCHIDSAWMWAERSPTCCWSTRRPGRPGGPRPPRRRAISRSGCCTASTRCARRPGSARGEIAHVLHGTTVATNAILEGKGATVGLVTTRGFRQVLQIARSFVPGGLAGWIIWPKPEPLAALENTVEVPERIGSDGTVVLELDEEGTRAALRVLRANGVEALAVSLINAFANDAARAAHRRAGRRGAAGRRGVAVQRGAAGDARVRAGADHRRQRLRAAAGRPLRREPVRPARPPRAYRRNCRSCAATAGSRPPRPPSPRP